MVDICWLFAFPITASEEKQDWLKETELPLSGHLSSSHHERDVSLLLGLFLKGKHAVIGTTKKLEFKSKEQKLESKIEI